MPDTEQLIRKTLADRAATIAQSNLRYPNFQPDLNLDRPVAQRHHGRTVVSVLTAAATVLAIVTIAIGTHLITDDRGQHVPAGTGHTTAPTVIPTTAITGIRWMLEGVTGGRDHYGYYTTDYTAWLAFTKNGHVTVHNGTDRTKNLTGTYSITGAKITLAVNTAGAPSPNPQDAAQIAVASTYTPPAGKRDPVTSGITLTHPNVLTLTRSGALPGSAPVTWTMTFVATVRAPSVAPSSTH